MKIVKSKLSKAEDIFFRIRRILIYKILKIVEDFKGIDTLRYVDVEELGFTTEIGYRYEHTKKKYLSKVLKDLEISHNDSIIDVGSGKGSALIEFSKYPFGRISGVEYSQLLNKISYNNLKKLKIKNVDLICMDATKFEGYSDFNYFYFYNPFPVSTFKKVLNTIIKGNANNEKTIFIIYKNPTCHDLIVKSKYFEFIKGYRNKNKVFPQLDYIYIYKSKK